MLTETEKEWLERRKNLCTRCEWNLYDNPCIRYGRAGETGKCKGFEPREVGSENYRDAAEFESRVSENLARDICFRCPDRYNEICPKGIGYFRLKLGIASCGMKHARLAAEAEMDAQSN